MKFPIYRKYLIKYVTKVLFSNQRRMRYLAISEDFLINRKQRAFFNGQKSTGNISILLFPQGSILGPLLFLIYINNLAESISSKSKFFADDTPLFYVVCDPSASANEINDKKRLKHGVLNGKRVSIPISWSKHKKLHFHGKKVNPIILIIFSMKIRYKSS